MYLFFYSRQLPIKRKGKKNFFPTFVSWQENENTIVQNRVSFGSGKNVL
jgi:hypothetical protein